jgi:neopullulanase
MNYLFTRVCFAFFIGDGIDAAEYARTSFRKVDPPGAEAFRGHSEKLLTHYHPNTSAVMMNLLGSHDLARFLHFARGDKSALRLATLFQMTFPGAPSIYYGDEIGMAGGHDPDNRRAFRFDRPEEWDRDLLHDFQKMIALRRQRPALRRGSLTFLYAEGNVAAFLRQLGDESVVVGFNVGTGTERVDLPVGPHLPDGLVLEDVWSHEVAKVEASSIRRFELSPRSGRVLATPNPR